jgi:hypothetical protein
MAMGDSNLRLNDLLARGKRRREVSRLINIKVPVNVLARLNDVAARLGATKTEVVLAMLNEGLDAAERQMTGFTAPPKVLVPKEKCCVIKLCDRERVAHGLCATHYQAQRRAQLAAKATTAGAI